MTCSFTHSGSWPKVVYWSGIVLGLGLLIAHSGKGSLAWGQERSPLNGGSEDLGSVHALVFSPDGKILAAAHEKGFRVWDIATAKELFSDPRDEAYAVAFSPDGKLIATGMKDNTVCLWEASTGAERLTLKGHKEGVTSVAFSPDGKTLVSGSYDGTICFWELPAGKKIRTIRGNEEGVTSIAFSPDGKILASGGISTTEATINTVEVPVTQADVVRLWDVATGKELRTLAGRGSTVAFSSDGKTLASGGLTAVFHVNHKPGQRIAIDHQGIGGTILGNRVHGLLRVNAVSIQAFHRVHLWEAATGKEITSAELKAAKNVGSAVAFAPDGTLLAAGAGPVIDFRSTRDGNLISSEEGWTLASLWEVSTGKRLRSFNGKAKAVAFSPDGKTLTTGDRDGTVRLWDVALLRGKR